MAGIIAGILYNEVGVIGGALCFVLCTLLSGVLVNWKIGFETEKFFPLVSFLEAIGVVLVGDFKGILIFFAFSCDFLRIFLAGQ